MFPRKYLSERQLLERAVTGVAAERTSALGQERPASEGLGPPEYRWPEQAGQQKQPATVAISLSGSPTRREGPSRGPPSILCYAILLPGDARSAHFQRIHLHKGGNEHQALTGSDRVANIELNKRRVKSEHVGVTPGKLTVP